MCYNINIHHKYVYKSFKIKKKGSEQLDRIF